MKRREFLRLFPTVIVGFLATPRELLARQRNVADFLRAFSPVYDANTDWDFGQGHLLIGISGHTGNFHIFIDDQRISSSVDLVVFDPRCQRLQIRRADNTQQVIFDYDPRQRTAPKPLH